MGCQSDTVEDADEGMRPAGPVSTAVSVPV